MSLRGRCIRWAWVFTLVPGLLAAHLSTATLLYRCRYDGIARRACCCPPAKKLATPETARIVARGCCDIERLEIMRAPVKTPESESERLVRSAPVTLAPLPVAAQQFALVAWTATTPTSRAGPPILSVTTS